MENILLQKIVKNFHQVCDVWSSKNMKTMCIQTTHSPQINLSHLMFPPLKTLIQYLRFTSWMSCIGPLWCFWHSDRSPDMGHKICCGPQRVFNNYICLLGITHSESRIWARNYGTLKKSTYISLLLPPSHLQQLFVR